MNIVNPSSAVKPVESATSQNYTREEKQHQLPLNKIVRATVAEGGQDRVLLELPNRRFAAETRVPLQTGQKIDLLVTSTHPRIELQLVENTLNERLASSLHLLGEKLNIVPLLQTLHDSQGMLSSNLSPAAKNILEFMLAPHEGNKSIINASKFSNLAQQLGLNLEKLLAERSEAGVSTLKSALLEVAGKLLNINGELADQVSKLLQHIELFQLLQIRLDQQGSYLFPLPLEFFDQGYLLTEKKQNNGENSEPTSMVSLHLSLKGLGDLRVDFLHDSHGLFIRFFCESKSKAEFISAFQEELTIVLDDMPLQSITFTDGAKNPAKLLLEKVVTDGNSVLNTRI